jgi:hypothetical protein
MNDRIEALERGQWQGTQCEILPPGEADPPDEYSVEMPPVWVAEESEQFQQFLQEHNFVHFCQEYNPEIVHVNVGYPEEYSYIQGLCSLEDAKHAASLGLAWLSSQKAQYFSSHSSTDC